MEPLLRFPEFHDKWDRKTLDQLLQFKNGINASKEQYGHGRKFINVLDILNNDYIKYELIKDSVSVSFSQEEAYRVEYGDLLFLRSSETRDDVGKCNVYLDEDTPALFGGFVIRGKKAAEYDPYFLKLLLNASSARNQISSKSGGSTRYNVSQDILESVIVSLPTISEQVKVSRFFTLLDKKIRKQHEKIEQLELFQKGLLQKIFSQEIRFKDENGLDYPEWSIGTLGELGSFIKSYSFSRSMEGEGEYRHIHYGDIHSKFSGIIDSQTELPSISVEAGETSYTLLTDGDVLFADASEDTSDLGKCVVLLEVNRRKIIGGLHTHCFRTNNHLDPLFLQFFTKTDEYRRFIKVNANGVSVYGLSKPALSSLEIPLPDIEEQKKISGFLYKLSKKIELLKQKKIELEAMKRGFISQMFV
ncbi:restriction endonuclease subunit S [Paenibacillus piri]|uniref:Restriction endonuclease subunit S n=1 Tax=Paenibacillus piri TaxID=2547395 RepID=A0A4R5KHY6_9BACL|nr:restriction endonuclease subunit S [Paenibacillus piri]TDF94682.1 restriction endonuclease subunit S [Paenibacillus piri]